mgnify:CR=1 FL=1
MDQQTLNNLEKDLNNSIATISKEDIVAMILDERIRQFELPGSEWDANKTPNDWIAVATHYLTENTNRNSTIPNSDEFEENLIKASAIILAAIEHIKTMKYNGYLK